MATRRRRRRAATRRASTRRTAPLRRLGRATARSVDRLRRGMSLLVVALAFLAAGTAALAMEMIGPPPRWGIASLWVRDHRELVHLLLVSLAMLPGCLLAAVGLRGGRIAVLLACVGLAIVLAHRHPESVRTIAAVIWAHRG